MYVVQYVNKIFIEIYSICCFRSWAHAISHMYVSVCVCVCVCVYVLMYVLFVCRVWLYILDVNALAQGIKSFLASYVWSQAVAGARTYGTDSPR